MTEREFMFSDVYSGKLSLYDPTILNQMSEASFEIDIVEEIEFETARTEKEEMLEALDYMLFCNLGNRSYTVSKLKRKGFTNREIGKVLGINHKTVCEYNKEYNRRLKQLTDKVESFAKMNNKINDLIIELRGYNND